jgi:hypothetical protein
MQRIIRRFATTIALVGVPSLAAAQHSMSQMENPKHELGVDISFAYEKPSGGPSLFAIATPVDVRLGFRASDYLVVEPRFAFNYLSGGGSTVYTFTPDLNFLFAFQSNRKGGYFTAGAGVDLAHVSSGGVGSTASQFNFNGGIGTRVPYESGAIRLEAFTRYFLKNTSKGLPNILEIGARIGLSLWH